MAGTTRSCIVIGAGLAGLAAAYRLKTRGWKVTVLDAVNRPGGRVFSYRFTEAPNLVCELGGEWIGSDHHGVRRLCRTFKLGLQPHRYFFSFWNGRSSSRIFRPGEWSFSRRLKKKFDAFARKFRKYTELQQRDLDRFDWWTSLETLGFKPSELPKRDLMDSTDFGESIRLSSAYMAATEHINSNPTDEIDFKIRGGNIRLVYALID